MNSLDSLLSASISTCWVQVWNQYALVYDPCGKRWFTNIEDFWSQWSWTQWNQGAPWTPWVQGNQGAVWAGTQWAQWAAGAQGNQWIPWGWSSVYLVDVQASTSSITPVKANYDIYHRTAQAAWITINDHSWAIADWDKIEIRLLDDNVAARTIHFGTEYYSWAGINLPTTTIKWKNLIMWFEWNAALSKFNLLALWQED